MTNRITTFRLQKAPLSMMTSAEYPSYKDRDRVSVLEKQIEDFKMLTSQQSLTIRRLQEEGIAKADRITSLLTRGAGDTRGSLTMTRHLRSIGPSELPVNPLPRPALDPSNIRDSKMQQLINEVQYWKRHFNLAEEKIVELKDEKVALQTSPLRPLNENTRDPESLYMKKLLEENSDLKMKLHKLKSQNIVFDDEIDYDNGKENNPSIPSNVPDKVKKNAHVSIKSKSQNILKPKPSQIRSKSTPSVRADSRRSDPVKSTLAESRRGGKAADISSKNRAKDPSPSSRVSFRPENDECDYQDLGPQYNNQHPHPPPHHHQPHHHHHQPSQHMKQQIYDLSNRNRCLQNQVCSLRAELAKRDSATCACNLQSSGAGGRSHQPTSGEERSLRTKLDHAEAEISKLEAKCDHLLEQKKAHLEKISGLQKHLDTLLSSPNIDNRVRGLINNIQAQRDAYKHQVEKLIKDLQGSDRLVIVERDKPSEVNNGLVEKTGLPQDQDIPDTRVNKKTIISEPRRKVPESPDPDDMAMTMELLQVRAQLAETSSMLDLARREGISLRRELDSAKQQLELNNVKQTQTSPTLDRDRLRHELEGAVNDLKTRIIDLEKENLKLRTKERKRKESQDSVVTLEDTVDAGRDTAANEQSKGLHNKLKFLESQLDKTEDSLRNFQNKNLELNNQIMKLKQEELAAKKNVDDLQLKLDKKDEIVRRVIDDKDKLLLEVHESRNKLQEFRSQVHQKSELLTNLDKSKDSLEGKVHELETTVKQLERAMKDRDTRMEEVRSVNSNLEEENRNVKLDNGSLRVDLDHQRSEVERLSDESRGKTEELVDIRAELQRYITEVKRVEELLDIKESDRVELLAQYEELSKEVSAYEATNRSLEMQAANLMIEVRSREDDLLAAKQRCEGLEKYVEEILGQNEEFRLQVSSLAGKVDSLTSDLKSNRVTRDGVISDLESVNELAVRLNSEKADLASRISNQNRQV